MSLSLSTRVPLFTLHIRIGTLKLLRGGVIMDHKLGRTILRRIEVGDQVHWKVVARGDALTAHRPGLLVLSRHRVEPPQAGFELDVVMATDRIIKRIMNA